VSSTTPIGLRGVTGLSEPLALFRLCDPDDRAYGILKLAPPHLAPIKKRAYGGLKGISPHYLMPLQAPPRVLFPEPLYTHSPDDGRFGLPILLCSPPEQQEQRTPRMALIAPLPTP